MHSIIHSFQFNRLLSHDIKFKRQPRLAVGGRLGNCQETFRLEIKAHEDPSPFTDREAVVDKGSTFHAIALQPFHSPVNRTV